MKHLERLVAGLDLVGERIIESPFLRNSRGRMDLMADLRKEAEAGGEVSEEYRKRINRMPCSWRNTAEVVIESAKTTRTLNQIMS